MTLTDLFSQVLCYNTLCVLYVQTQTNIYEMVVDMHTNQSTLEKRVNKIEEKLATLQVQFVSLALLIPTSLCVDPNLSVLIPTSLC